MKKIRNFLISITSFVFMMAVGLLAITVVDSNRVTQAESSLSVVSYEESYTIGESITIQPADFNYQGKNYPAKVLVRLPDDNAYQYERLVLSQAGVYYVEYSAVADDNTLLKEIKSFTVLADVYSVAGEGEFSYGSNAYLEEEVKGLNVTLGRNSTFMINTPINVSELTKDDSIFKFYTTPEMKGSADVGGVYVRLTDVHDQSKFVEVQYQYKSSTQFQYIYATANGQSLTGLRQTSKPTKDTVDYNGFYYDLSHNNTKNAGHVSRVSFDGTMDATNKSYIETKYFPEGEYTEQQMYYHNAFEVRMDYAKKQVYCQPDGVYAVPRCILADFDDERALGDSAPWEGFTTGEVFISVYAKDYMASNFNFFITGIYDQDVGTMSMKNEIAPRLSVDTQDYDVDNLPNAIVGKKYNLFDAFAKDDVDGDVDVRVKVYNSIGVSFSVMDNSFIPTQAGVYIIEYSAQDAFENKTVKMLTVQAIERESVAYTLSDGVTKCKAGEVISIKELQLFNVSNLYQLKIFAKNEEQGVVHDIDEENLTFVPLYSGIYTITYLYSDYCEEQAITYEIVVTNSDLTVFDDDIVLPKYIIRGIDYPVVQMQGYTFANGTKQEVAQFYIKEGNGQARLVDGDTYSVQSDVAFVELIYKIGNYEKTYQKAVVDAVWKDQGSDEYKVNLAKYFYSTVGTFRSVGENKRIKFQVDSAENGKASLEVINPARLINGFNIGFHFESGETNFTGVKVVFTGAYNPNKTVEFKFEREVGSATYVRVRSENFSAEGSVSGKFATPVMESDNFNITYLANTMKFDIGGFNVDARKLLDDFDDLFYISFEMYGVSGTSAIYMTRVVNQKITSNVYDSVRPVVAFDSFASYYVVGDELRVSAIKIYDFVDPNPACSVTLKNDSGYLIDTNGVELNGKDNDINTSYVVQIDKIDRLNFKIIYEDFSWNGDTTSLSLNVKDVVVPTVSLVVTGNLYQVGATITIADYIAVDDVTAESDLDISCYLIGPDGSVEYLSSQSFTADKAGAYNVFYIVRDEAGNNAYANYVIIVE